MEVCYLKFHPYVDVVKYDNGEMELVNDYIGETLCVTPFVDKLIIEAGMTYPNECMSVIKEVKAFYAMHSTKIWYLQKQLLDKELSLQSASL